MLDELATEIYDVATEHGFWDTGFNDDVVGKKLALIHSEVTEVLEAVRKEKGREEVEEELADILIRTLDLYQGMLINNVVAHSLDDVVKYKVEKNKLRPRKHGVRF